MPEPIDIQILRKIKKAGRGRLFFAENFLSKGTNPAIRKALERLVKKGELCRVATGIYVRPEKDPILGYVSPRIENIAQAIAKKDKARIVPTGLYALNKLGLSTQVPMNIVYLTDGAARNIKIGNRIIHFKKSTPKNVSTLGKISGLAIQALRALGKNNVSDNEIRKIQELLRKEKRVYIEHDIRLAPEWIRKIIFPVIKENQSE